MLLAGTTRLQPVFAAGPRRMLSAGVRLHRHRSNHELAEGLSPWSDPERALRAAQLRDPRTRRRLAREPRDVPAEATAPRRVTERVPLRRSEILATATASELVARGLIAPEPVAAQGLGLAEIQLCDGASPLCRANGGGSLVDDARRFVLLEDDGV